MSVFSTDRKKAENEFLDDSAPEKLVYMRSLRFFHTFSYGSSILRFYDLHCSLFTSIFSRSLLYSHALSFLRCEKLCTIVVYCLYQNTLYLVSCFLSCLYSLFILLSCQPSYLIRISLTLAFPFCLFPQPNWLRS